MPELPEVQTIVDDLKASLLVGKRVERVSVFWPRTIHAMSPTTFCRKIEGNRIVSIGRRGKFIVIGLEAGFFLLIHLRMSGRLLLTAKSHMRDKHEHVWLTFTDGNRLRYHDTRKFGRMYLVEDTHAIFQKLGPEPLSRQFTARKLTERLGRHRRMLKPLLLDQSFVAGLGNIYVDEALWAARLHPRRMSHSLDANEVKLLHRSIRLALRRGLKNLGTSLGTGEANFYSVARRRGRNKDELKVFRRNGSPCPRCRTKIERIVVGQRSTHICPECQKNF